MDEGQKRFEEITRELYVLWAAKGCPDDADERNSPREQELLEELDRLEFEDGQEWFRQRYV